MLNVRYGGKEDLAGLGCNLSGRVVMRGRQVLKWTGTAAAGGLSVIAAWKFVEHPYYGLMLMDPLVMIVFYLAYYGGGLAILVGLGMAAREIARR